MGHLGGRQVRCVDPRRAEAAARMCREIFFALARFLFARLPPARVSYRHVIGMISPASLFREWIALVSAVGLQLVGGVGPGLGQRRPAGASRPRVRARATASPRWCVPSLAYRWRMWVLTVFGETYSSFAISGVDRLVGR